MNSCYYDEIPEVIIDIPDIPDSQIVSFSSEIQPIFSNNCINCHNADVNPDLREGNSYNALVPQYVNVNDASTSRLYNYLPGNGHHDIGSSLTTNEIALIKAWINRGALNN